MITLADDDEPVEPVNITPARTIHSFGSKDEYKGTRWNIRAGGLAHENIKSRTPESDHLEARSGEASTTRKD